MDRSITDCFWPRRRARSAASRTRLRALFLETFYELSELFLEPFVLVTFIFVFITCRYPEQEREKAELALEVEGKTEKVPFSPSTHTVHLCSQY